MDIVEQLRAEIAAQTQLLAECMKLLPDGRYMVPPIKGLPASLPVQLGRMIDACRADAERYRWLRKSLPEDVDAWTLTRLAAGLTAGDKHIDDAIAAQKEKPV